MQFSAPLKAGRTHNDNVSCLDATNYVMISDWQGSQRVFTISNRVYTGDVNVAGS